MGQMRKGAFAALALGVVCMASQAWSAPLGLVQRAPDIAEIAMIQYTLNTPVAGQGKLTITGMPATFDIDGSAPPDYNITGSRSYTLNATLDMSSGAVIDGDLTITGGITPLAISSGSTLLTGKLGDFGFLTGGGNRFEFVLTTTGGLLQGYYPTEIGVIATGVLGTGVAFNGSFAQAFNYNGIGSADTFAIPTPAALPAGMALTGLLGLMRRRKASIV